MDSERIEARGRRAPFLWASSAAFRLIVTEVPDRERQTVGWVYTCLAATASEAFDGSHQGFGATAGEIQGLAGVSRPTFRKAIQRLEELGLLIRENRTAENGRTTGVRYVLTEPGQGGGKILARGETGASELCPPNARTGSVKKEETSLVPREGTPARVGDKPVSYRGKRVKPEVVGRAEGALAVFNEMTGRGLSARKGDGHASAMLKQIIGTMLEWPDVSAEDWARAIRNTAENPPDWVDGKQLQIGHIFGARAVQHALANDGCASVRRGMAGPGSVVERNMSQAERWARGEV